METTSSKKEPRRIARVKMASKGGISRADDECFSARYFLDFDLALHMHGMSEEFGQGPVYKSTTNA